MPERVLTLQAELQANWPEVTKEQAGKLMNVILFEPLEGNRTKITSYGCGYGAGEAFDGLLKFFVPANERLFGQLQTYLGTESSTPQRGARSVGRESRRPTAAP